ncbi:MAG TPA: glycine--tRNA ligase subunit beta, partial [Steroidobacteraceae bacterium]|nr:glycine--tRNA ligase subunit beta [Steroidobacteraceae bacterium]
MAAQNLLVELFVEEMPPKALKLLGESFAKMIAENLSAQGLIANSKITPFSSPRRLAVHIASVSDKAADKSVQQKLMPVSVGLDSAGNATLALLKRLSSLGVDASTVSKLKRAPDGKTESLFLDITVRGANLTEALQKALDETLANLPIPKV